jgi:periplasmic protein TonB
MTPGSPNVPVNTEVIPRSEQYGAPELKRLFPVYLRRSILLSSAIALAVVGLVALVVWIMAHNHSATPTVVVPYREMQAPPPLSQQTQPQVAIAQPTAPPTVGAPIPVPESEAPQEQTIATQEEISNMIGSGSTGGDSVVIQPPSDELPAFGEFVYVEELPEAITRVPPDYPEIARASGTEGTVMVQALVGKDGKVKDVRVVKSVPVLDDAAVKAVKQWVFKPALSNNKPVAVWVAVPVRFSLH